MSAETVEPIVIVGGGLAGPTLALTLHKHSLPSIIYESRPASYIHGGSIAMAPNALRVMDHIGLLSTLLPQGYAFEHLAFTNGAGHVLGRFLNGSQKEYNFPALRIHRAALRQVLLDACAKRGIEIKYGKKCLGVKKETEDGVELEFEGAEIVKAPMVIACDGIHSKVREHLAPGEKEVYSGLMGIMGAVMKPSLSLTPPSNKAENFEDALPAFLYGANGSFAIIPSNFDGTEMGFFATLEYPSQTREQWAELEADKEKLKGLLLERFKGHEWPSLVEQLCEKSEGEGLSSWPFFSAPHLTHYTTAAPEHSGHGRIILIGDAAHAIPPFAGQGAAMAFEDADTLAYTLLHIARSGSTSTSTTSTTSSSNPPSTSPSESHLQSLYAAPSAIRTAQLQKWEQHRMARIARVLDFTTKNGELRKSSPHFYEQAGKEWLFWVLFKLKGEGMGMEWLYRYNGEGVNACLV